MQPVGGRASTRGLPGPVPVHGRDSDASQPRPDFKYASTKLLGGTQVIDQDQLLKVISEPGAGEKEVTQLFTFWRPNICGSRKSTILSMSNKQLDIMYAVAGCIDVIFLISRVKPQVRKAVEQTYGIDKNNFAIWYKNRGRNPSKTCYPDLATLVALKRPRELMDMDGDELMHSSPPLYHRDKLPPSAATTSAQTEDQGSMSFEQGAVQPAQKRRADMGMQAARPPLSPQSFMAASDSSLPASTVAVASTSRGQAVTAQVVAMPPTSNGTEQADTALASKLPMGSVLPVGPPVLLPRLTPGLRVRSEPSLLTRLASQQQVQRSQPMQTSQEPAHSASQPLEQQGQGQQRSVAQSGHVLLQAPMSVSVSPSYQMQPEPPQAESHSQLQTQQLRWAQPNMMGLLPGYHIISVPQGFQTQQPIMATLHSSYGSQGAQPLSAYLQPHQQIMLHPQALQPQLQLSTQALPVQVQAHSQVQQSQSQEQSQAQQQRLASLQNVQQRDSDAVMRPASPAPRQAPASGPPSTSTGLKGTRPAQEAPTTSAATQSDSRGGSSGGRSRLRHSAATDAVKDCTSVPAVPSSEAAEARQTSVAAPEDRQGSSMVASASKPVPSNAVEASEGVMQNKSRSTAGRTAAAVAGVGCATSSVLVAQPASQACNDYYAQWKDSAVNLAATCLLPRLLPESATQIVTVSPSSNPSAPSMSLSLSDLDPLFQGSNTVPVQPTQQSQFGHMPQTQLLQPQHMLVQLPQQLQGPQAASQQGVAQKPAAQASPESSAPIVQAAQPAQLHAVEFQGKPQTVLLGGQQVLLSSPMYTSAGPHHQDVGRWLAPAKADQPMLLPIGGPGQTLFQASNGQTYMLVQPGSASHMSHMSQTLPVQLQPSRADSGHQMQTIQLAQPAQAQMPAGAAAPEQPMCIQMPLSMLGQCSVVLSAPAGWQSPMSSVDLQKMFGPGAQIS